MLNIADLNIYLYQKKRGSSGYQIMTVFVAVNYLVVYF